MKKIKYTRITRIKLEMRRLKANLVSPIQIFYGIQEGIVYLLKELLWNVSDKITFLLSKVYSVMIFHNLF